MNVWFNDISAVFDYLIQCFSWNLPFGRRALILNIYKQYWHNLH